MASVDKTSIRNEVSRVKAEFVQLYDKSNVSSEAKLLMNSMFMIIELMLSIFLEKKTAKDNKNSSKPSSQTEKDETALGHTGRKGKGKQERDDVAANTRTRQKITLSNVIACDVCGEPLHDTPCIGHERRTKIDIVFEKVIEHIDAQIKQCPTCEAIVKGVFPTDMHGPMQYGDGLKAYIINLLTCHMVAINRVQKRVKSMIGVVISEATLLKFVLRLHQALMTWEIQATEHILAAKAIHVDETSLRVNKKNHWIHVYAADDITLKFLHKKRGKEAINVTDINPRYGGVIIHDCWASYLSYSHCDHGLCGSHILRELTFIIDSNDYDWAKK